jgi:CrcB protein
MNIILIGTGGALGAISRYLLTEAVSKYFLTNQYIGTLSVNILGCFFVGLLFGFFADIKSEIQLFFIIGFLGSFTTMSAFSIQTLEMFNNQNFGEAALYIFMTIVFTIMFTYLGFTLGELK